MKQKDSAVSEASFAALPYLLYKPKQCTICHKNADIQHKNAVIGVNLNKDDVLFLCIECASKLGRRLFNAADAFKVAKRNKGVTK